MKKLFMSAMVLSIVLISCQKQGVTPQTEAVSTQTEEIKETTLERGGNRHFFDGGGGDLKSFCMMSGNCLPTFIVYGAHERVMKQVTAVIKSNNPRAIGKSFKRNRSVLIQYINPIQVDAVINEECTVKCTYGEENAEYFQIKNHNDELVNVYPLVISE